ncbi:MAG: hypothetical protein J5606_08880 [Bacteroidales bacterium]|nr:hypothetical protein [Bacteroidales bacterium]
MSRLKITDNKDWTEIANCVVDSEPPLTDEEVESVKSDIELIANKTIETQRKNNPNLLVFPQSLGYHGDDIGKGVIISLSDNKISTNNIMGFVGVNQTQIDIRSRFANGKEDYFLHYMLQKVFSINLFEIKHTTTNEPIFDFLLYMFPHFLKKAVAQGVFKKYRRFEYNDANIRGPIDVSRHIRQNIPFRGTVAYSTRQHTYDNELTQLVRHTIEYIRTKAQGSAILNIDSDTKDNVNQIVMATQSYNARERQRVINQNIRPVRHPYFAEYTALQKICLQILRHESIKYGQEKDKIYGILFDGAWLWEEYLNKVFEENKLGITHAKNKTGDNGIQIYKGSHKYFPDFYNKEKSLVLDAKYKRLGRGEIDEMQNSISICRDDLFQMITYMHVLPAKCCVLLYPLELDETQEEKAVLSKPRELYGLGGDIYGIGIPITQTKDDYELFCNVQKEIEIALQSQVGKL